MFSSCCFINSEKITLIHIFGKGFDLDFRPKIKFQDKEGLVLLDQIRAVDKSGLLKKVGMVTKSKAQLISDFLVEIFEY